MDGGKTLEGRLLCRVSLCSMDVWYYCCIYVVHIAPMMLCACIVVYIWYCVHVVYAVLCTNRVVHMLDMWCCVHVVHRVLRVSGVVYMSCM